MIRLSVARIVSRTEFILLRVALVILGGLFAGVGIGSAVTGGLAGDVFAEISQVFDFRVARNHYQFYAGVFGAASVTVFLCGFFPALFHLPAMWALGYVAVGGLFRISLFQWDVLMEPVVFVALMFEVVLGGLLGVWLWYRRGSLGT